MSALPLELASRGHTVMTVTPRYTTYSNVINTGLTVPIKLPGHIGCILQPQQAHDSCNGVAHLATACSQATSGTLQAYARLFHHKSYGVDRVFVDHPLLLEPHSSNSNSQSSASSNASTYLEGKDAPNLDLQYSILCQAALAAPVLLWHQPQHHLASLRQQALLLSHPLTLSGGVAQHVGIASTFGLPARTSPRHTARQQHTSPAQPRSLHSGIAHTLPAINAAATQQPETQADQQMRQWLTTGDQSDCEMPYVIWPESAGEIGFIGNDWPCAPLSLHLSLLQNDNSGCLEHNNRSGPVSKAAHAGHDGASSAFQAQLARLLKSAKTAFCIHNMAFQGVFPQADFARLCLPDYMQDSLVLHNIPISAQRCLQSDSANQQRTTHMSGSGLAHRPQPNRHETHSTLPASSPQISPQQTSLNWMQAAMQSSHCLLTVSQGFASELKTKCDASHGLHHVAQSSNIRGITNGMDTTEWNPQTDPHLPATARYNSESVTQGKAAAKALFRQKHGLQQNPAIPLVAFVGRLHAQKGVDVLLAALPHLLPASKPNAAKSNGLSPTTQAACAVPAGLEGPAPAELEGAGMHGQCQMALLGAGERWMEGCLRQIQDVFPGQAVGLAMFSEEAAHQLLAAADYLVVPSRYEPCGLVALHGLRYGAVPLVASAGGLADIATPENAYVMGRIEGSDDSMHLRADAKMLATAIQEAVSQFGSASYEAKQQAGMTADLSWKDPATEWEQALTEMLSQ